MTGCVRLLLSYAKNEGTDHMCYCAVSAHDQHLLKARFSRDEAHIGKGEFLFREFWCLYITRRLAI